MPLAKWTTEWFNILLVFCYFKEKKLFVHNILTKNNIHSRETLKKKNSCCSKIPPRPPPPPITFLMVRLYYYHVYCQSLPNQVDVLWLHRCNQYLQLNCQFFTICITVIVCIYFYVRSLYFLCYAFNILTYINPGVFINIAGIPILF